MKTAIFLPDKIYYEAKETACCMGIPRSKLYLNALVEYFWKKIAKKLLKN
jgi:hypothetical protein